MYNVLITNVPGPQVPLFAAGFPVDAMYPVAPLGPGQALAVSCTSYNGAGVFRHDGRPGRDSRRRGVRGADRRGGRRDPVDDPAAVGFAGAALPAPASLDGRRRDECDWPADGGVSR